MVTFIKLTGEAVVTEARSIVFICRTDKQALDMVIEVMKTLRAKESGYSFHLFMVPRETQMATQHLRDNKVYDFLTIREIDMDLIPIDNDILSMELDDAFTQLYCDNDLSSLKTVAEALLKLQVLYGPFKTMDAIGEKSESVLRLLQSSQPSQLFDDVIVARSVLPNRNAHRPFRALFSWIAQLTWPASSSRR